MKNVTVSLDEDLARWLRVRAAEEDLSVSRFLASLLETTRREEDAYRAAMDEALATEPEVLRESPSQLLPRRDELYEL